MGSGKEVLLKLLAYFTGNHDKPLEAEDAAALSAQDESMMASLLFGIEKGVAPGVEHSEGYISQAHKQGIFIIDGMEYAPLRLQLLLRRVFDPGCRRYRSVGGKTEKQVKCQLVGVFNIRPEKLIHDGALLPDYLHRFTVRIYIPPLRDRKEDISPRLVRALIEEYLGKDPGKKRLLSVIDQLLPPQSVIEKWQQQEWRESNVRELQDAVVKHLDDVIPRLMQATMGGGDPAVCGTAHSSSAMGKPKGGRPKGRGISDDDLVEILRKATKQQTPVGKVFDEIDTKKSGTNIVRTRGALSARIRRISEDVLPKPEARTLWTKIKKLPEFGTLPHYT